MIPIGPGSLQGRVGRTDRSAWGCRAFRVSRVRPAEQVRQKGAAAPGSAGGGPQRQRWTVTVVPAQVATTALDRHCRPYDSTRYFAVVGRRARSQASVEVTCPNHSNRPTWDPCRWTMQKTLPIGPVGGHWCDVMRSACEASAAAGISATTQIGAPRYSFRPPFTTRSPIVWLDDRGLRELCGVDAHAACGAALVGGERESQHVDCLVIAPQQRAFAGAQPAQPVLA